LRYENFSFVASSTGGAATPTAAQFAIVPGYINPFDCYPDGCPPADRGLWFGVHESGYWSVLSTASDQSINVAIGYDVVSLTGAPVIGGFRTYADPYTGGLGWSYPYPGQSAIATTVDAEAMLELFLAAPSDLSTRALFDAPTGRAHVRHDIQLATGGQFLSFNAVVLHAVPLPGSGALLVLAFGLLGTQFHRAANRSSNPSGQLFRARPER
jgi:hypothetical protein